MVLYLKLFKLNRCFKSHAIFLEMTKISIDIIDSNAIFVISNQILIGAAIAYQRENDVGNTILHVSPRVCSHV